MAIVLIFQEVLQKFQILKLKVAGDVGISVGEASQVEVNNLLVKNAHSCVVSKDLSVLKINNISLYNCNVFFFSLQKKKSEFGGAKIIAEKVKANHQKIYILQTKSL